jgi:uncharacterized protein (DUF1810 family)
MKSINPIYKQSVAELITGRANESYTWIINSKLDSNSVIGIG